MAGAPCKRVQLEGNVAVARPPAEAFALFTPSGERAWAPGWEPQFPSPGASETEPGTIFVVDHDARRSVWAVVSCEVGRTIQYATVTPGERAGLITVTCQGSSAGTEATVKYDLTALSPDANAQLEHFAANFPSFLRHWEQAIAAATDT
jgi:hypothetical protein